MLNETRRALASYPVGYHELHPDRNMNFQMNRCLIFAQDPSMEIEMREVAPRISTHADWIREFRGLAERAHSQGREVKAIWYWRSAEFFMNGADPERKELRERFVRNVREANGVQSRDVIRVPYRPAGPDAWLPSLRFGEGGRRGTMLLFGGFDSYFEELIPLAKLFSQEGYDVILFEGPGQGDVLERGIPMTARWELPVSAVLDHYGVQRAVAIGMSLGGYLVLRAAALEPRITRAIAWDVIYDFSEVLMSSLAPLARGFLRTALALRAAPLANAAIRLRMRDPVVEWGVHQGMRVFGEKNPYGLFRRAREMSTRSISRRIEGDVLLLAGTEDHFVPLRMLHRQLEAITGARSLTARIFTHAESAHAHCQLGNLALAVRVILEWLESIEARDA